MLLALSFSVLRGRRPPDSGTRIWDEKLDSSEALARGSEEDSRARAMGRSARGAKAWARTRRARRVVRERASTCLHNLDGDARSPVAQTFDARLRKIEIDERGKFFEIRNLRPRISTGDPASRRLGQCRG